MFEEMNDGNVFDSGTINFPGGSIRMMAMGLGDIEGLAGMFAQMEDELREALAPVKEFMALADGPIMENWAMAETLRFELGHGQSLTVNNPRNGGANTTFEAGVAVKTTWKMPVTAVWQLPIFGKVEATGTVVTTVYHHEGPEVEVENDVRLTCSVNGQERNIWVDAEGHAELEKIEGTVCQICHDPNCVFNPATPPRLECDGYVTADISVDGPPYQYLEENQITVA